MLDHRLPSPFGEAAPAAPPSRGDWMQTYTGRAFYPLAPAVEDIDPVDIAHALSMICRFGGHTSAWYSVGEHCVLMSRHVAPVNALWALLHDAPEAYVGDMVRPLKYALPPAYRQVEKRIMLAVCDRFGLSYTPPAQIKEIDTRILRDERDALMRTPPLPWNSIEDVPPLGVRIESWPPAKARLLFLERLDELTGRRGAS